MEPSQEEEIYGGNLNIRKNMSCDNTSRTNTEEKNKPVTQFSSGRSAF